MTLHLSPEVRPDEIRKAKKLSIVGVKSYPRGVTTNSDGGIESYEMYYPIFEAMQEVNMVLNLHGEVPSDADAASRLIPNSYTRVEGTPLHRWQCIKRASIAGLDSGNAARDWMR